MVLQNKEYNIEDFLKDVNFVCPKNFSIGYILVPDTKELDKSSLEGLQSQFDVEPVSVKNNNIYYCKKDPRESHSFSSMNRGNYEPLQPMPKHVDNQVDLLPNEEAFINNPFNGNAIKVVEKTSTTYKALFRERIYGLPRNTLVVFRKD